MFSLVDRLIYSLLMEDGVCSSWHRVTKSVFVPITSLPRRRAIDPPQRSVRDHDLSDNRLARSVPAWRKCVVWRRRVRFVKVCRQTAPVSVSSRPQVPAHGYPAVSAGHPRSTPSASDIFRPPPRPYRRRLAQSICINKNFYLQPLSTARAATARRPARLLE